LNVVIWLLWSSFHRTSISKSRTARRPQTTRPEPKARLAGITSSLFQTRQLLSTGENNRRCCWFRCPGRAAQRQSVTSPMHPFSNYTQSGAVATDRQTLLACCLVACGRRVGASQRRRRPDCYNFVCLDFASCRVDL
ncbi:hypothetical protein T11_16330, partial [Trichinella zimbabwensis]